MVIRALEFSSNSGSSVVGEKPMETQKERFLFRQGFPQCISLAVLSQFAGALCLSRQPN
jgi:hypothetical protein